MAVRVRWPRLPRYVLIFILPMVAAILARFNSTLSDLHRRMSVMLKLASAGRMDGWEADQSHEALARELSALAARAERLDLIAAGLGRGGGHPSRGGAAGGQRHGRARLLPHA